MEEGDQRRRRPELVRAPRRSLARGLPGHASAAPAASPKSRHPSRSFFAVALYSGCCTATASTDEAAFQLTRCPPYSGFSSARSAHRGCRRPAQACAEGAHRDRCRKPNGRPAPLRILVYVVQCQSEASIRLSQPGGKRLAVAQSRAAPLGPLAPQVVSSVPESRAWVSCQSGLGSQWLRHRGPRHSRSSCRGCPIASSKLWPASSRIASAIGRTTRSR